ncbi:MAG: hypothetical protein O9295_21585 [Microcystis sp. LE18-22.4A]|nr:hypothetical protein [Microcystis sp. LE18-22.4A]
MTTSKLVKPHTPHPTPHTLPPGKTFSADPSYSPISPPQRARSGLPTPHGYRNLGRKVSTTRFF